MKILIVDDSKIIRETLKIIFEMETEFEVVGEAESGEDAVSFVLNNDVDVITMDYNLLGMNGLDATKRIMETKPVPIVIMSTAFDHKNSKDAFRALEVGALSVFDKPNSLDGENFYKYSKDLIRHLKIISSVEVIKRKSKISRIAKFFDETPEKISKDFYSEPLSNNDKFILIGASTGGPKILKEILSALNSSFNIPIVIVQHITKNFTESMVNWLNDECELNVKIAKDFERIIGGNIYFAPDDQHLTIGDGNILHLDQKPLIHSCRPSISRLFHSAVTNGAENSISILLTGMGKDGAAELGELRAAGSTTIAQNEETCIVFGMPQEAIKLDAAQYIFSPPEIISFLNKLGKHYEY